jgi:hypothetical protein
MLRMASAKWIYWHTVALASPSHDAFVVAALTQMTVRSRLLGGHMGMPEADLRGNDADLVPING